MKRDSRALRVTIIEPNAGLWEPGVYTRHSCFEPIGAESVAAVAAKAGHHVSVLQQRSESTGSFSLQVIATAPDVLGLSTMTYNFDEGVRIARAVKQALPKTVVVIGGSHVTAIPDCVGGAIDIGVVGEGEVPFLDVLSALATTSWPRDTAGVVYRDSSGALRRGSQAPRVTSLDDLPFPLRTKDLLGGCRVNSLVWPPPRLQRAVAQITYSRGCPFTCSFCTAPQFWGKAVSFRSTTSVMDELRTLKEEFGTNLVFFTDLTFNVNRRKVFDLCEALLAAELEISWYPMCRLDLMDRDLAMAMAASGCVKVAFGIDSIRPETLRRIKAGQRVMALDQLEERLRVTWESGILTRAYMITGYPWERTESMIEAARMLATLSIDDLRISFLTPFPATETRREMEPRGLVATNDWRRYTTDEPTLHVEGATAAELTAARAEMFRTFYASSAYRARMEKKISLFPRYAESYDAHLSMVGVSRDDLLTPIRHTADEGYGLPRCETAAALSYSAGADTREVVGG